MNNGPWKHGGSDSGRLFCFLLRHHTQRSLIRPTIHRSNHATNGCLLPPLILLPEQHRRQNFETSYRPGRGLGGISSESFNVSITVLRTSRSATSINRRRASPAHYVLRSRHRRCGHIDNRQLAALQDPCLPDHAEFSVSEDPKSLRHT